jgi:hypothetical protein
LKKSQNREPDLETERMVCSKFWPIKSGQWSAIVEEQWGNPKKIRFTASRMTLKSDRVLWDHQRNDER